MILKNKKALVLSSILTLLPIPVGLLLWNRFPEYMTTHWGLDGQPDGFGSVAFAVFFTPLAMLAAQWICIFFTAKDPGNKDRNKKPLTMVLWIIPVISNLCSGLMYALALGVELAITNVMVAAFGLMFVVIGNYLPKCKMNSTMGIKVPWAYTSEENWNATHRFGGRVWVIGGFGIAFGALLPGEISVFALFAGIIAMILLPTLYSWRYYRMQKERGDELKSMRDTSPRATKASLVFLVLVLVFVAVILFTGKLHIVFAEDSFTIEASYYSDLTVNYDAIEAIELREGNVPGLRVGGFGSFRLLMGFFENEEFGVYTRYTYYQPEVCIVMTVNGNTLVISGEDASATQHIYRFLLEKTNN